MQLAGGGDAACKVHRSFVGSRPLRGRLRFLRMTNQTLGCRRGEGDLKKAWIVLDSQVSQKRRDLGNPAQAGLGRRSLDSGNAG